MEAARMDTNRIKTIKDEIFKDLTESTLPFWTDHAIDEKYGGYSTCLDRKGNIVSPHKPMWVTGRFAWVLAKLYNDIEKNPRWLELSKHGIDFLNTYGFDSDGRMFFLLNEDGRPIRKRRYLFTETFAVIALAEYGKAAKEEGSFLKARELMSLVLDHYKNPEMLEPKYIEENYKVRGHSMAMIQINTLQVLRNAAEALGIESNIPEYGSYDELIDNAINEVFTYFVKPEKQALLETVGPSGEYLGHLPEGRLINPGHAIETAWFVLEEAKRTNNRELIQKTLPLIDWSFASGWDKEYGGLLSFVDLEGKPPFQLEWDMKLWWPHNEAIYATLLAYTLTQDSRYEELFEKVYTWTVEHFPDTTYGEWIGYLHRDGTIASDVKGNYFKGPFHIPRQEIYTYLLLKDMLTVPR